ncbi:L7Ae/L30e/S12e/Gadd45 family ribosomal protein [Sporolituus thermophilus]|uniref:L7Ae/L30e/S12e/Gadd45 family ribosomal protein n=1 Tax=Sporolituus thermophilus TaxID=608505 RepID=UPI000B818A80|nr:ribosomal L7Ae/L30e/S12e/Gadd45 family protein [Sporolituus thermophilus]
MNEQKIISLLGLAQRAKKVISGEFAVEKAVRSRQVKLLLVAEDASYGTQKKYRDMATYYQVPLSVKLSKEKLGFALGKSARAAVAVTDDGFSKALLELLSD